MPLVQKYLTYVEYQAYTTSENPLTELDFNRLEIAAENALDAITNGFYRTILMENDYQQRVLLFKKAMTAQIDYYQYTGTTNSYQQSVAQSVTIGRTSISNSSTPSFESGYDGYPKEVISMLTRCGLLYRGVGVLC